MKSLCAPSSPPAVELVAHLHRTRRPGAAQNHGSVRVALTPMHGVGGQFAMVPRLGGRGVIRCACGREPVRARSGLSDRGFPNPEEPGAVDALLELAAASTPRSPIALDPDADRCAIAVPTPAGWRMLSGDETGWLLGDYILSQLDPVPSRIHRRRQHGGVLAHAGLHRRADDGAQHVETLTGFKWLSRADADRPGSTLVYAYEEAIGHCVDPAPSAIRTASARPCWPAILLPTADQGRTCSTRSTTSPCATVCTPRRGVATRSLTPTRPPRSWGGSVRPRRPTGRFRVDDNRSAVGARSARTDALVFFGGDDKNWVRMVVRPSGTEPKVKSYIEVRCAIVAHRRHPGQAEAIQDELVAIARRF